MRLIFGSDHAGYKLKKYLTSEILTTGIEIQDMGCYTEERCDYPDIAQYVSRSVNSDKNSFGILICGTGIGISIAANKVNNIRCALCNDLYSAEMAKKHNNANIIAMGARLIAPDLAYLIIEKFIKTEGGFEYGNELVAFIKKNFSFCIGAACYPEGHVECKDLDKDIENLKRKVDSGVDFLVTQLFFDNRHYFEFLNRAHKASINVPVIPGIMPILTSGKPNFVSS